MRLSDLTKNATATIVSVEDVHPADSVEHHATVGKIDLIAHRLRELGFVPGGTVTVVSEIEGNLIVNVKDSRVAIGKDMANKIMV